MSQAQMNQAQAAGIVGWSGLGGLLGDFSGLADLTRQYNQFTFTDSTWAPESSPKAEDEKAWLRRRVREVLWSAAA